MARFVVTCGMRLHASRPVNVFLAPEAWLRLRAVRKAERHEVGRAYS